MLLLLALGPIRDTTASVSGPCYPRLERGVTVASGAQERGGEAARAAVGGLAAGEGPGASRPEVRGEGTARVGLPSRTHTHTPSCEQRLSGGVAVCLCACMYVCMCM